MFGRRPAPEEGVSEVALPEPWGPENRLDEAASASGTSAASSEGLILVTYLGHFLLEHLVFPRMIEVTFCRILKLLSRAALRAFG